MKKTRDIKTSSPPSAIHSRYTRVIIYSIRRLMRAGELYTKELNKIYNISSAQLNCLLAIHENGPMAPSQIAKLIMINSSTITGIIDRLEHKGLVKRLRISNDRRVITVELTKIGKVLAENAPPPIDWKLIYGLNNISQRDIKSISDTLEKFTKMLEVQDLEVT